MSANKKRTKGYKPRAKSSIGGLTLIASINRAKAAARPEAKLPMPEERQTNVCIAYHQSIEAMTAGRAEGYHLDTIIYALNIGVILAEGASELGADHLDLLADAMEGIKRSKERYLRGSGLGLDGDALVAIRAVYDLHEEQMRVATLGELDAAIAEMHKRVGKGLAMATDKELEPA